MASLRFSIALTNKSSGDTIHKTNETEGSIVVPHFEEVHIENTNSCGYKCVMCPRESQTRSLGYMSLEDFSLVLTKVAPFDQTFHLHGFGEPLLDRKLPLKLQELKKRIPTSTASIFSTLGVRVKEDHFHELLHSGLDLLIISFYGFTKEEYQRVHGFDGFHLAKKNLKLLSEAKKQFPKFHAVFKVPASTLSPLALLETQEKLSICHWVKELGFEIREWTYLHNYSSGRSYNAPEPNKLCPVIHGRRRGILNITWDLNVIPCCYDFNATIPFGNLRHQSLYEIFTSPAYLQFLIAHKNGELSSYPVCQNCEKNDYS